MDKERLPVSERIKRARLEKNCTIHELATACGVCDSAINNYESGLRVPRDTIKPIMAEFLGVTVQDLFF